MSAHYHGNGPTAKHRRPPQLVAVGFMHDGLARRLARSSRAKDLRNPASVPCKRDDLAWVEDKNIKAKHYLSIEFAFFDHSFDTDMTNAINRFDRQVEFAQGHALNVDRSQHG
jgi:hypothetical protein